MNDLIFPMTEVLGQPAVCVTAPDGAQVTVSLYGGHVLSWIPAGGQEQLYLSPQAQAGDGKAIRGGVPVIFPRFNQRGTDALLPRHGLARTRLWSVDESRVGKDHAQLTLVLCDSEDTRSLWPHGFALELTVAVNGQNLEIELHAHNTGESTWAFDAALHTYLAVSELQQVRLQGLEGCGFEDCLSGELAIEDHPEKRFYGTIDRIYSQVPGLLLREGPREVLIGQSNMPDAVIWNPGPDGAAALSDMPDGDWQHMLCIEAAQVLQPITLAPDETWTGRQSLAVQTAA